MVRVVLFALALSILAQLSGAVYFYVSDKEPQCFLQEVPSDTAIVVKYANLDMENLGFDAGRNPTGMLITVKDPEKVLVLSQNCEKKGSVAWTSAKAGEYLVCVSVNNGRYQGQRYKFGMTFANGEKTVDYTALAKQEHLSAISIEIRKLLDRVNARRSEQTYQRNLEVDFRDESEATLSRIKYYSIFQSIVIIVAGVLQIVKLRSFFKSKRLH